MTSGTKYYYRVRAEPQVDAQNADDPNAGWSADDMDDAASATTHGATPDAPTNLEATGVAGAINLTWEAPVVHEDNGFEITGYQVYKWTVAVGSLRPPLMRSLTATEIDYADEDLATGSTHYYVVRACQQPGCWCLVEYQ